MQGTGAAQSFLPREPPGACCAGRLERVLLQEFLLQKLGAQPWALVDEIAAFLIGTVSLLQRFCPIS